MSIRVCFSVYSLILMTCTAISSSNVPKISSHLGIITGEEKTSKFMDKSYTIHRYLGIPYAKAPVGHLRFKRPELYGSFSEPFDATKYGPGCPQLDILKIGLSSTEEDCLFLNIVVPVQQRSTGNSHKGRAVMVFIHGGGFILGTGDIHEADVIAPFGDVIVVTFNFRLGVFGFLNTGDGTGKGNMGLWDQRLALQWVHNNIADFGGDNNRVTVFGQSAGAMSVFFQAMYPPNKGLFQNIIVQSGAPTLPMNLQKDNAHSVTELAGMLGCSVESVAKSLDCIALTDASKIMDVIEKSLRTKPPLGIRFAPTVDGDFIAQYPDLVVQEAIQGHPSPAVNFLRSLSLINGMDGDEGAMWLSEAMFGQGAENMVLTRYDLKDKHISNMLPLVLGTGREVPEAIINMVTSEYTAWNEQDINNARKMFVKFMSDVNFNVPGYEYSLLHANSSSSQSWMYSFETRPTKQLGNIPSWVSKASHGDELSAVFGYHISPVTAVEFNITDDYIPPDRELQLSHRIMNYWTTFAKTGNPNGNSDEVSWPTFDLYSQKTLKFERDVDRISSFLYAREHQFWRQTIPGMMDAISKTHYSSNYNQKKTCSAVGTCG